MEILQVIIEKENTEKKIKHCTENHRATVVIYSAPIEEIENRIVIWNREKEVNNAEQEERRIQRRLEEERRILEVQIDED